VVGGAVRGEVNDLEGKVALVTGGGSGIGRATALALANAGASVVVADISEDAGTETQRLMEAAGGRGAFVRTDVTSWDEIERMVAFAEETFGGLHIVHNNAGVNSGWPSFPDGPREKWERTLAINLWAVIAVIQAAVPALRRAGGGVIVNSASLSGLVPFRTEPVYAATKHAVVGLTRSLGPMKQEENIRVNCVCPSFVDTPLPRSRLADMNAEDRARWEAAFDRMPMLKPEDVAEGVLELVRDESLSGAVMTIVVGEPRKLSEAPTG
jgi:NAD(P)-dependent dehydrogenase (short-subunit alcohol dehydrogenase family)